MILVDSVISVRLCSSSFTAYSRSNWGSDDAGLSGISVPWKKVNKPKKKFEDSFERRKTSRLRIEACGKYLGSGADQVGNDGKSGYHPFEYISDSELAQEDGRLTAAQTSRTIVEVNSRATLMFSGLISNEVHDDIFWPDLLYLTDEHGNIYFQVNNNEDIMQALTSENNYVQVVVGLNTAEMMAEMEISGPATIDFGIEELEDEEHSFDIEDLDENDEDDDYDEDWVDILEDDDTEDSDGSLGDWAKLDTMNSSHPMYFAKKIAEVSSDDPIDFMRQPAVGLAVQGLLRPAFIEEQTTIQKLGINQQVNNSNVSRTKKYVEDAREDSGIINGHANETASSENKSRWEEDLEKENKLENGTTFYRLEMIKIELISAYGDQTAVEVEDYKRAQPDSIAHSASKIMDRVKAAGMKTANAFKALCWRCKGIPVDEASLIGIDCLGFDLRVCSGTQVQTLRFAFSSRATSEYSAERQLNSMLFPRIQHKQHQKKQTRQRES